MKTEYLSIKDFAEKAGVSQQSLYKRLNKLNNQLNNYIKVVDNQKMIDIRALQDVYGVEVEQPIQPLLQATIESLSKELERKSEELQAKDKQYADLQTIINEQLKAKDKQIENLQKLLDQEQQLNAMNQQKISLLESKLEEPTDQEPIEPDEPPTEQKGFWAKLFKK